MRDLLHRRLRRKSLPVAQPSSPRTRRASQGEQATSTYDSVTTCLVHLRQMEEYETPFIVQATMDGGAEAEFGRPKVGGN